jgi:hypothetical protein
MSWRRFVQLAANLSADSALARRLSTPQDAAASRKASEPMVDTPEEAERLMFAMLGLGKGGGD